MAKRPLHARITDARAALGLTQQEVAKRLGVSPVTVSRWETGRMAPSRRSLLRLMSILGDFEDPEGPDALSSMRTVEQVAMGLVDRAFESNSFVPLLLFGVAGTGKTHLAQEIAAAMAERYGSKTVSTAVWELVGSSAREAMLTKTLQQLNQELRSGEGGEVFIIDELDSAGQAGAVVGGWLQSVMATLRERALRGAVIGIAQYPNAVPPDILSEFAVALYLSPVRMVDILKLLIEAEVPSPKEALAEFVQLCGMHDEVATPRELHRAVDTLKLVRPDYRVLRPRTVAQLLYAVSSPMRSEVLTEYEHASAAFIERSDLLVSLWDAPALHGSDASVQ